MLAASCWLYISTCLNFVVLVLDCSLVEFVGFGDFGFCWDRIVLVFAVFMLVVLLFICVYLFRVI